MAQYYGIKGSTLQWIIYFLCGSNQWVLVDEKSSNNAIVQSEGPQGGVLGPLMFLLFINNPPESPLLKCANFDEDFDVLSRNICTDIDTVKLQKDLSC